ncbi:MAG TPA: VOC family protein [Chthonomonadaceae bacterium]|nr:VOC family protein [Chthonomonadaceae bacterium]
MNRVVHFDLPVTDPERSIQFYSDVFGWKFHKWEGPMDYWLITTGEGAPGINGGMGRRQDPAQTVTCTMEVENVDATCQAIEAAGGQIIMPKMAIPGVGWLAQFKDPNGLISGVIQSDPTAGQ